LTRETSNNKEDVVVEPRRR